jgi:hypothetical protein
LSIIYPRSNAYPAEPSFHGVVPEDAATESPERSQHPLEQQAHQVHIGEITGQDCQETEPKPHEPPGRKAVGPPKTLKSKKTPKPLNNSFNSPDAESSSQGGVRELAAKSDAIADDQQLQEQVTNHALASEQCVLQHPQASKGVDPPLPPPPSNIRRQPTSEPVEESCTEAQL